MKQFSFDSSSLANLSCFFFTTCMLISVRRVRTQFGGLEPQVPVSVSKIWPGTGVFFWKTRFGIAIEVLVFPKIRNSDLGLLRTGTKSKIFELKKTLEVGTNQKLTVNFGPGYLKPGVIFKRLESGFFGKISTWNHNHVFFPCEEPDAKPKETILTLFKKLF